MTLGWKARIGLVLSAVWVCLAFLVSDEYRRLEQVLGLGLLPLVVIWGIVWAIAGWRAQRPPKPTPPPVAQLEAAKRRSVRIRTAVVVVSVLALGVFAANWQVKFAAHEGSGNAVATWFGEWSVYGLIAYAILRAIPRLPTGFPAVLAALIVVGAVNYKTYSAIALDRQALDSLAKATPLFNKILAGTPVTDQEVRDARVGLMEPLLLAQATYSREVNEIAEAFRTATDKVRPELMLTPTSLASQSIRVQSRAGLQVWQLATAAYKTQLEAATARGRLAIQAAESQMPAAMSGSALKGFDESAAHLSAFVGTFVAKNQDATKAIEGLLDLMDANQGGYAVDTGPPINLMFREEITLAKYRQLIGAVNTAAKHLQEAAGRLAQAQADRAAKLGTLFNR